MKRRLPASGYTNRLAWVVWNMQQRNKLRSSNNVAPINTQQASFAPEPSAGNESEVGDGEWESSSPITYEYQWQLDEIDIPLATAKTLLVLIGMVGQSLRCIVKATNRYGFTLSITVAVVVTI